MASSASSSPVHPDAAPHGEPSRAVIPSVGYSPSDPLPKKTPLQLEVERISQNLGRPIDTDLLTGRDTATEKIK